MSDGTRPMRLRTVSTAVAAIAAFALVLAGLLVAAYNEDAFKAQATREAQVQADILAASVGAALAFGGHVHAAVDRMDVERRVKRQEPQRNVVGAGTHVEQSCAGRQVAVNGGSEDRAPSRAASQRRYRIAFVVISRHVPENFWDQGAPRLPE